MSPGDKSCFSSKVFHFNIEDHMAVYSLVTIGRFGTIGQYLEGGTYIFHLGRNGIGPIGISVLFVNLQCIFHGGRNFDPKLEVLFEVSGDALSCEGYNPVAFLQHMWHVAPTSYRLVHGQSS